MKKLLKITVVLVLATIPVLAFGQSSDSGVRSFHTVLEQIYEDMMPLCSDLIGVSRAIAGFAATWYIAYRVWRHIANAEPIDFFPLFRPFVLGFCIMIFPSVLAMINAVMKPTVTGTAAMVDNSNSAVAVLLKKRDEAFQRSDAWQMYVGVNGMGDQDKWYRYTHDGADPAEQSVLESLGNGFLFNGQKIMFAFKYYIRQLFSEILQIIFEGAALCINTLRTFQLIVLSILGPLIFGLAVFDGFQHTLTAWLARYINIFLWLPVANIFGAIIGKIQQEMIKLDIHQMNTTGDTSFFNETDTAYMIFMIIGIIGYFTVPSVASYIVQAGGGGALQTKATGAFNTVSTSPIKLIKNNM
ncbi:conjugative transposon protein TraJ [Pedobacter sp.]